jgi:hypothetical protein
MSRRAASIATGALVALTLASPAHAAPPQRDCPPSFELLTYEEQVEVARERLGLSRKEAIARVEETLALIDKNGDTSLCYSFPENGTRPPNVVDNTARGTGS